MTTATAEGGVMPVYKPSIRFTEDQKVAIDRARVITGKGVAEFVRDATGDAVVALGLPWPPDPEHGGYRGGPKAASQPPLDT